MRRRNSQQAEANRTIPMKAFLAGESDQRKEDSKTTTWTSACRALGKGD